jgi:30S ribosomal protein S31
MGKGDKKTKRGKIISGTYGVRRRRKRKVALVETQESKKVIKKTSAKTKEAVRKKSPVKKEVLEKVTESAAEKQVNAAPAIEKKGRVAEKKAAEKPKKEKEEESPAEGATPEEAK